MDGLFAEVAAQPGYELTVDLEAQQVRSASGKTFSFDVDPHRKYCLLNGLDDIGLSLRHVDKIKQYEAARRQREPWIFT
jgi:3-isopropylmalate/(R)-2-methylmalate dehydratase small subunit